MRENIPNSKQTNIEDFNSLSGRRKMNKMEINGKNNFKIFIIFPCLRVLMKGIKKFIYMFENLSEREWNE